MQLKIYDIEYKNVGNLQTAAEWNKLFPADQAVKDTVVYHLARVRGGTASSKLRGEVDISKRKPWKQKGTGRARIGKANSPIWRGGGVTFGPKPRNFSFKLPKKVRRLAFKTVLGEKLHNKDVLVIDKMVLDKPSTKTLHIWLKKMDSGRKPLLIMEKIDKNILLSIRNMKEVVLNRALDVDVYTILNHGKIIITESAWKILERRALALAINKDTGKK